MRKKISARIRRAKDRPLPVKTALGFALALISGCLQAATIYQYSGNSFDGFHNSPPAGISHIEISITLPSPMLPDQDDQLVFPTAYSMTDGLTSITEASGYLFFPSFTTTPAGQIIGWSVNASDPTASAVGDHSILDSIFSDTIKVDQTQYCSVAACVGGSAAFALIADSPGIWSVVPVPPAIWLFGSGLGLLGWMRRKAA